MRSYTQACFILATLASTSTLAFDQVAKSTETCQIPDGTLLPDLMTVVPMHLGLQNAHQQEILRFSNGIANLGEGLWFMEPQVPEQQDDEDVLQEAYQIFASTKHVTDLIPPAEGPEVTGKCHKGSFEFHPTHNHWHISNVAEFKVCEEQDFLANQAMGTPHDCTAVRAESSSIKVTYCLIDWYKLGDNMPNSDPTRNFFDCETSYQGVSPGWVDQYNHSTPDQQITITGIPEGNYYLVSTSNHEGIFEESDLSNNTSWTRFHLSRHSNGNPKLTVHENSCSNPEVLAQVEIAAANFAPHDIDYQARIVDDMCGGRTTNR